MRRRVDLAEFASENLEEIANLDEDVENAIGPVMRIATASRAGDLLELLLEASDDD